MSSNLHTVRSAPNSVSLGPCSSSPSLRFVRHVSHPALDSILLPPAAVKVNDPLESSVSSTAQPRMSKRPSLSVSSRFDEKEKPARTTPPRLYFMILACLLGGLLSLLFIGGTLRRPAHSLIAKSKAAEAAASRAMQHNRELEALLRELIRREHQRNRTQTSEGDAYTAELPATPSPRAAPEHDASKESYLDLKVFQARLSELEKLVGRAAEHPRSHSHENNNRGQGDLARLTTGQNQTGAEANIAPAGFYPSSLVHATRNMTIGTTVVVQKDAPGVVIRRSEQPGDAEGRSRGGGRAAHERRYLVQFMGMFGPTRPVLIRAHESDLY